jgi:hypothetical protein
LAFVPGGNRRGGGGNFPAAFTFPTDGLGVDWTVRPYTSSPITWQWLNTGAIGGFHTDSGQAGHGYITYDTFEFSSSDGSAVIRMEGPTNGSSDYNGIVVRADCSDWDNSTHLNLMFRGTAMVYVWELTGPVGLAAPCNGCTDAGTALADGDYAGIAWIGDGTNLIVRFWNFQSTPPANLYDWTTWGTCAVSAYDTATAPGCTIQDYNVSAFSTSHDSGGCFGIYHRDTGSAGNAGISELYLQEY